MEKFKEMVEEILAEAKMKDSEVLAAAKKLAKNGKNDKTKKFGQGLVDYYEKEGSFTPDQVSGLQNIMKNAGFQFAEEEVFEKYIEDFKQIDESDDVVMKAMLKKAEKSDKDLQAEVIETYGVDNKTAIEVVKKFRAHMADVTGK